MSKQTVSFVMATVARVPKLTELLDTHRSDNRGEVLPHVFFGDVTRYAVSSVLATADRGVPPSNEVRDLLEYLEVAFSDGGTDVRELISASFLENLPRVGEAGDQIRTLVGPNMTRQLHLIK